MTADHRLQGRRFPPSVSIRWRRTPVPRTSISWSNFCLNNSARAVAPSRLTLLPGVYPTVESDIAVRHLNTFL